MAKQSEAVYNAAMSDYFREEASELERIGKFARDNGLVTPGVGVIPAMNDDGSLADHTEAETTAE